jgi:Spy/CpxP family protein refolding chaperone
MNASTTALVNAALPLISRAMIAGLVVFCDAAAGAAPYAGQQSREIKALSAAEQADLLAGRGMGLAKAAELNGYPGPAHVLELAAELELDAQQRRSTRALFESMERRASELGSQIVEEERALDALFASRQATPARIEETASRIGQLQARLRAVHLEAHLDQIRILSAAQVARYNELRGYAGATGGGHGAGHPAGGHRHRH